MVDGKQDTGKPSNSQGRSGRRRRRGRGGNKSGADRQADASNASGAGTPVSGGSANRNRPPEGQSQRPQNRGQKPHGAKNNKGNQQQKAQRPIESQLKGERKQEQEKPEPPFVHVEKRYGVVIYDTIQAARADIPTLTEKTNDVDQLNVVIRAEGHMDDPELTTIPKVKVFAGTAWTLIHERRLHDGWYDSPR